MTAVARLTAARQVCAGSAGGVGDGVRRPPRRASARADTPMQRFYRAARALALAAGVGLATAAAAGPGLDVNVASAQQLETLRGIGPKTAQTIIDERARSGPFLSFQDFAERIRGIGPKRAESLRAAGLRVGSRGRDADGALAGAASLPAEDPLAAFRAAQAVRAPGAPADLVPRPRAWDGGLEPVITTVAPFDR